MCQHQMQVIPCAALPQTAVRACVSAGPHAQLQSLREALVLGHLLQRTVSSPQHCRRRLAPTPGKLHVHDGWSSQTFETTPLRLATTVKHQVQFPTPELAAQPAAGPRCAAGLILPASLPLLCSWLPPTNSFCLPA